MTSVSEFLCRLFATVMLIGAMAASGFAHTSSQSPLSSELAAYVAAGGSLGDICQTSDAPDEIAFAKCDACLLIGAAVLPCRSDITPIVMPVRTAALFAVARHLHNTRPLDPARLTRAPPQA